MPGLGGWGVVGLIALVLGGLFLFNGSGGVHVSPLVIATVAIAAAAFFGIVTAKALEIRRLPPPAGNERIVGSEARSVAPGLTRRRGRGLLDGRTIAQALVEQEAA